VTVIGIFGPTASGKSRLAEEVAGRLNGEIVSADAMQVYRGLPILTNQSPARLVSIWSLDTEASVGDYAPLAHAVVDETLGAGRVPIVVGGTGLYFKVLLEGLSPVPSIDPDVRAYWRAQAATRPAPELYAILSARDAAMAARLMPTDPQRIVRALEVLESTGRSLADWQRQPGKPVLAEHETVRLLAVPDRAMQAAVIDARFDAMLAAGALEEVRTLLALGLSGELPVMRALGVAALAAHVAGKMSLEAANICTM